MLYFLISILIMSWLLDKALRQGRTEALLIRVRFKLFALRDELREAVIDGTAPDNRWFEYLDTTITKLIDHLPQITAWEALAFFISYRRNDSVLRAQEALFDAMCRDENRKLQDIYSKLVLCIIELLFHRHIGITLLTSLTAHVVGSARTLRNRVAQTFTVAPETSTLLEYAN